MSEILLRYAYNEKGMNVNRDDLETISDWIVGSRNVIYIFHNSTLKIDKGLFQSSREPILEILDFNIDINNDMTKTIRNAIFKKFNLKPENIKSEFFSYEGGIIFSTDKPFDGQIMWTKHKLHVGVSENKTIKISVKTKQKFIWIKKEEIDRLKEQTLKEKVKNRIIK